MTEMAPSADMERTMLASLLAQHGELMTTDHLRMFLGFKDRRGLTRAAARGAVPFSTFEVPGRKGIHARTRDVASWLANAGMSRPH